MFANQRWDKIYDLIQKNGAVEVSALVKLFNVSAETIRKDLLAMEQKGMLKRVYGGALKADEMKVFEDLTQRNTENITLKKELSENAMNFIAERDYIAIDSGSTALIFAKELKKRFKKLTVVTHNKDVFDMLANYADFNVILCGGYYLEEENAFYGEFAVNTLKQLHVRKAFVFISAISLNHGLFDFQKDLLEIQKEIINCSDKVYILADSSKFEKTGLLKLSDMREDFTYVTDNSLPEEVKRLYITNGYDIACKEKKYEK